MLSDYYFLQTLQSIKKYCSKYFPLVKFLASSFKINLESLDIEGDHLGVQVLNSKEFDFVSRQLFGYTTLANEKIIHNRRNRIFKFIEPFEVGGIRLSNIEIFEPKPGADLSKLKLGIEHIAFITKDFDTLLAQAKSNNVPIDKAVDDGSHRFFKTSFVNLVEIEFGNESLLEIKENYN